MLKYHWKWMACLLFILVLCLMPSSDLPSVPLFPGADKLVHGLMYFGLTLLLVAGFYKQWADRVKALAVGALVALLFGWAVEILQGLTPSRSCDIWDLAANTCGVLSAMLLFVPVYKVFGRWM